ncbi:MAG: AraC family transcriptional regulator [Eubacterium sp.]|nr:AraC family transcriptional regulator [Eubacterium sp.]MCI8919823.1 AraC family transcriptional regulator [Eubacterium sp.]
MKELLFSVFPSENFVDFSLYQFGWERCAPSKSFGPAARTHYLFHYVISGTGTLNADDSSGHTHSYQVKSGQGFMIFPEQVTMYIADESLPWEYVWIEFDGLHAKEVATFAGLSPNSPVYHAHSHDLRETMMNEMLYIAQHGSMPSFHLIGHLYLFLDALTRSISSTKLSTGGRLRDFYVHEAIAFIEQNFQNDISVENIADNCGLNRSYFSKIFRSAIGRTPQEFLLNYRMTKAAELLKLTHLSVSDVSKAVGYDNPLHFSRAYKNIYGISPRSWRNQNKIMK